VGAEEKKLATTSGELAAKVWNAGAPEKVLALHGWLDNAATFDRLAPLLPKTWEIVALDLPGHGYSYHRKDDRGYPFTDWVTVVMEVLDLLAWPKATLMGHSLGGGVAALYASVLPEKVSRLILIESLGAVTLPPEAAPERLRKYLVEVKRQRANQPPVYKSMEDVVRLRRIATKMSDASARIVLERSLKPCSEGLTWRSDPTLLLPSPIRLVPEQIHAFLRAITAPAIVIRATDGLQYELKDTEARLKALPHAKVVTIEGNHHVHLDHPERVAETLLKELK